MDASSEEIGGGFASPPKMSMVIMAEPFPFVLKGFEMGNIYHLILRGKRVFLQSEVFAKGDGGGATLAIEGRWVVIECAPGCMCAAFFGEKVYSLSRKRSGRENSAFAVAKQGFGGDRRAQ